MLKIGENVKVNNGNNKGKVGILIGIMPFKDVGNASVGMDIIEKGKSFWIVEFDNGKQDIIDEKLLTLL